jgi:ribosome biogenesis GTPase / thiamine phosphate phosphatase
MPDKKGRRVRVDFRKKHQERSRPGDLTRVYHQDEQSAELDVPGVERVSGKGELTRRRTVVESSQDDLLPGRVLRVHGLESVVEASSGEQYRCVIRQLLKSLATDQRNVVVAGDRVEFRPQRSGSGMIQRVMPRRNQLSRGSKQRQHVLAANVDQLVIVTSAAQPGIKPHLIDRLLVTAERDRIPAVICINKCDLVDPADLQPVLGCFAQLGYPVLLISARLGWNVPVLQEAMRGRISVVLGQSGVGKSSLLNCIDPQLQLRVGQVSASNDKGKHTTTTAELIPLVGGGGVIDTPGVRQFQLWDVAAGELDGFFRDLRVLSSHCRYPDCTHRHETDCAVKTAVADGRLDVRRFESYEQLFEEPSESY